MKAQDAIARLIISEDFIDATAGSFPVDLTQKMMQQFYWVFEPYTTARNSAELKNYSSCQMIALIMRVLERINLFIEGKAKKIEVDARYKIVGGGKDWKRWQWVEGCSCQRSPAA